MNEQASLGSLMGTRDWLQAESSHNITQEQSKPLLSLCFHGAFRLMFSSKEQEASQINRNKHRVLLIY